MKKKKTQAQKRNTSDGAKNKNKSQNIRIKEFVDKVYKVMVKEDLDEITWEEDNGFKIKLRRPNGIIPFKSVISASGAVDIKAEEKEKEADIAHHIRSPMNGIFYSAPSPGAESFVKENDDIPVGKTICIIEAMKLMNEVQVERHCKILKILVANGSPIKVSQPLFEVENM